MMNGRGHDDDEREPLSIEELARLAPRCTDSANVDAFILAHGRGYLFVAEWDSWIAWDGKRWDRMGARQKVINAALITVRAEHNVVREELAVAEEQIRVLALSTQRDEDLEARIAYMKKVLKWLEQSQNASRLDACAKLLESRLSVRLAALDANPWLLNVSNGTIDLRTAELQDHSPDDLITQIANVEWDDHATCPTWDAFIAFSMAGTRPTDGEFTPRTPEAAMALRLYLQRLVGYSITGLTREHILAFFHGGGSNGKSTFVQALRSMLGEYACAAPRGLLFEAKNQQHPEEIARLYGKRVAVCAEIGEYVTLDEAKVKDLTGGDTVSCRRMRENSWDLVPMHTLFISGNHKPTVRGTDHGIWRRIRLVPWSRTVTAEEVDTELPEKLAREHPGILRWAVNGCLEWQRIGLDEPEEVLAATRVYREESDVFGDFMDRYLILGAEERCSRESLRVKYEKWCEDCGHKPMGPRRVGARLREKGVREVTVRDGGRVKSGWLGCRMKTELELQIEAEHGPGGLS